MRETPTIPFALINSLCEAAGLDPDNVCRIEIEPSRVIFTEHMRDADVNKYVIGAGGCEDVATQRIGCAIEVPS